MSTPAIPQSHTPWQANPIILKRKSQGGNKRYQKVELLSTDPEAQFVQERFHQSKPHRYAIAKIYYINNFFHTYAFEAELINMEDEGEKFLPRWSEESHKEWKKQTIERWQQQANRLQLIVVHNNSLNMPNPLSLAWEQ